MLISSYAVQNLVPTCRSKGRSCIDSGSVMTLPLAEHRVHQDLISISTFLHHDCNNTLFMPRQGTEQVTDAQEWLQQLAASAQILFPDQMQQILLARLDRIQELEAEFAADADSDNDAEAEAALEADAEADLEADAVSTAAAGMHADAAPRTSQFGSTKSHVSDTSATASISKQQGEESVMHTGVCET